MPFCCHRGQTKQAWPGTSRSQKYLYTFWYSSDFRLSASIRSLLYFESAERCGICCQPHRFRPCPACGRETLLAAVFCGQEGRVPTRRRRLNPLLHFWLQFSSNFWCTLRRPEVEVVRNRAGEPPKRE